MPGLAPVRLVCVVPRLVMWHGLGRDRPLESAALKRELVGCSLDYREVARSDRGPGGSVVDLARRGPLLAPRRSVRDTGRCD
jgi:hypothetical protein